MVALSVPADAREKWLWQSLTWGRGRKRGRCAIGADAEGIRGVDRPRVSTTTASGKVDCRKNVAPYRLNQAGAKKWAQHQVHPVHTPIDSPIAATDHRVLSDAGPNGLPGNRNTRAETVIERVELVLRVIGDIADQGKSDLGIVNIPLRAPLPCVAPGTTQRSSPIAGPTNMTCLPLSSFGGISNAQPKP